MELEGGEQIKQTARKIASPTSASEMCVDKNAAETNAIRCFIFISVHSLILIGAVSFHSRSRSWFSSASPPPPHLFQFFFSRRVSCQLKSNVVELKSIIFFALRGCATTLTINECRLTFRYAQTKCKLIAPSLLNCLYNIFIFNFFPNSSPPIN